MKLLSPAKVNLTLNVGPKRADGFHSIASVMARLQWGDEISIQMRGASETKINIESNVESLANNKNIVVMAAQRFSQKTGISFRADIFLKKNIPTQAGLGGGSGNAASILKHLKTWAIRRSPRISRRAIEKMNKSVNQVAASLGSDISFFLDDAKNAAWCTGRGEICRPLSLPAWPVNLILPQASVSTVAAYRWLDSSRRTKLQALPTRAPGWANSSARLPLLENDFEPVVISKFSELRRLKQDLIESGALCGQMSGSGSAFFGIYRSPAEARHAKHFLQKRGRWTVISTSLA